MKWGAQWGAGRWASACLALVLLTVIAVRFAEPIQDADLFWHMAYATQMLTHHTLVPDHTVYSWTPASNQMIYCAWASELFFHWLWTHIGMASLFVFRYLCVLAVMALLWNYARNRGLAGAPLTWLVLIAVLLASVVGSFIKPEIFSLVFFNAMAWVFFQWKHDGRARWLYVVPVLMLVWVNTHGAFILAAPFLAAAFAGEALNRRLSRHLAISWVLCGAAVLATPYGWRYPWQLFEGLVLARTPRPDVAWNDAHLSIFAAGAAGLHFIDLGILMAGLLVLLAVRVRRLDWSIVLLNFAYLPLFMVYVRTTYFWPAVFGYSALYLAGLESRGWFKEAPGRFTIGRGLATCLTIALFLFLGVRGCLTAWSNPQFGAWMGFGIGYINPVPEAEFLASRQLGPRMYNLFDSGGYLLWRLYPQYRVMVDSRSFPYLAWFDQQYDFTLGMSFDDFLRRYPADLAVIDLLNKPNWRNFVKSPDWRPVFYGPSAAVFLKRTVPFTGGLKAEVAGLKNAHTAFNVFDFAAAIGDYSTAWAVLNHVETRLMHQAAPYELEAARAYREGHRALRAGDYARAKALFEAAFKNKMEGGDRDRMIQVFLASIDKLRGQGRESEMGTLQAALQKLAAPE